MILIRRTARSFESALTNEELENIKIALIERNQKLEKFKKEYALNKLMLEEIKEQVE